MSQISETGGYLFTQSHVVPPIWSCNFRCDLYTTYDRASHSQLLIRQSRWPRLDSCSMGLAILSALVP